MKIVDYCNSSKSGGDERTAEAVLNSDVIESPVFNAGPQSLILLLHIGEEEGWMMPAAKKSLI